MPLTPEEKAALDGIFTAWGAKQKADADIADGQAKALALQYLVPAVAAALADPDRGPVAAKEVARSLNAETMLQQLQSRWPDEAAIAASVAAITANYPTLYTEAGLRACYKALLAAYTGLAGPASGIAAAVADVAADFSELFPQG